MRVLIVAATEAEIGPTMERLRSDAGQDSGIYKVSVCITGVGMIATTYELTKAIFETTPDFVLGAGIGGAFSRDLDLCDCVIVESEQVADFGAEDGEQFLDVFSMGLVKANRAPYTHRLMKNPMAAPPFPLAHLARVSGLTVMTVSGYEPTIARRMAHYGAAVESMEGAALHYVCLKQNIPFLQLRAISNYVTRRDKSSWKMKEAIEALNKQLTDWLK